MIKLDDSWYIKVDEYNYSIGHVSTRKSGKYEGIDIFEPVGHYSSMEKALEAYGRQIVRSRLSNVSSGLSDALSAIREGWDQVARTIHEALPEYRVIKVDSEVT